MESRPAYGKRIEVELGLSPDGATALARFSDNGPGVDAAVAHKIFDPFFSTKPPGVGSGLGLSTVFGVVKEHQGTLEHVPTPGGGATFRFTLPLEEGAPLLDKTLPEMQKSHSDEPAHSVN